MDPDVYTAEVVITRLTKRGVGVNDSPIRLITEVWTKDGVKIAESDPWSGLGNKSQEAK